MAMDGHTHYVIVVHGTFSAPVTTAPQWHQLDEDDPLNFCKLLNDRFEAVGLGRPIERALNGEPIRFSWSGANDHRARIAAAGELYRLITRVMAQDRSARVHLIAHSHGGNVVLKALEHYMTDFVNAACGWYWGPEVEMDRAREVQMVEAMERHVTRILERPHAFNALLSDAEINQIGQIVFLGTPFYAKSWRLRRWNGWRIMLRLALNALSAAVLLYVGLVVFYGTALLGLGINWVGQLLSGETSRQMGSSNLNLNVLTWSTEAIVYFSMTALVLAILAVRSEMRRRRRNIPNVYFNETRFAELLLDDPQVEKPPFNALVVSMDLLDEALLSLSTEPIVYGLLAPRIRALFQRRQSITREPMGIDRTDLSGVITDLIGRLAKRAWQFTAIVRLPILWATSGLYRPVVNALVSAAESFVLRIVSSAAFGVPPQEFSDSRIVVKKSVDVPAYFREVHHDASPWVQVASSSAPQHDRVLDRPEVERYAFLADDRFLEALTARSALCRELVKAERQLATRYGDYSDSGSSLLPRLRRVSVTLEHRLGDLVAGFGHVRYYSIPLVIDMIAQFIASGQAPATFDRFTQQDSTK